MAKLLPSEGRTENTRGQASIGTVILILVTVAIGSYLTYQITGSAREEAGVESVTISGTGVAFVDAPSVESAELTCSYNFSDTVLLTITLNGSVVENGNHTGTGSFENNVASFCVAGSNTLSVSVDNTDRITSLSTTLDIDSYGEKVSGGVEEKGYTAFNLLAILVIVLVAAVIIGVVLKTLGGATGT